MGVKDDVEETISYWKTATPLMKGWLVLSIFLASGSVASLSETLIKWKGFFFDALTFYRQHVSNHLQEILSDIIKYELPAHISDILVLFLLLLFSNIKLLYQRRSHEKTVQSTAGMAVGIVIVAGIIIWKDGPNISYGGTMRTLIGLAFLCTYMHCKGGGPTRTVWLINILSPFVVVGILGAINKAVAS